jgi:hypothetical protein
MKSTIQAINMTLLRSSIIGRGKRERERASIRKELEVYRCLKD